MAQSNRQLEWHLMEAEEAGSADALCPLNKSLQSNQYTIRNESLPSTGAYHVYELILGIAFIYGLAGYFIWQQAAQRMAVLEQEMVTLSSELSLYQSNSIGNSNSGEATIVENDGSSHPYRFETEYLRFEVSERIVELMESGYLNFEANEQTMDAMTSVAAASDAKYRQLHRDFSLPLAVSDDRLKIVVDPPTNADHPFIDESSLFIPLPKIAAERYGTNFGNALTNEIFVRLSSYLFDTALDRREIKPQWQAMTMTLNLNLLREKIHRQLAQTRSIDLAQHMNSEPLAQSEEWLALGPTEDEVADSLVEFILETYGYNQILILLDGFEEHTSWETLAPAVFGISASQLEAEWQAYVKAEYPFAEE